MRRCLLFVMLGAFACDEGAPAAEEQPVAPSAAPARNSEQAAGDAAETAKGDAPVLTPPSDFDDGELAVLPPEGVEIWIGKHGLWVGRDPKALTRVMGLTDAKLAPGAAEIVEPLAEALHAQPGPGPDAFVVISRSLRADPVMLHADAATDLATLRRVLTTARAVGFSAVSFVVSTGEDRGGSDRGHRGFSFRALRPVAPDSPRLDEPMRLELKADGAVALRHRPMSQTDASAELERVSGFAEETCVVVRSGDETTYATFLAAAAWISRAGVECLMLSSVAVPSDLIEPPPPPPPPPPAGEEAEPGAAVPPVEPPAEPPVHPAAARVSHWWALATAAADVRSKARCEANLAQIRTMFAESTEGSEARGRLMTRLASEEEECGDAERGDALHRLRAEAYPKDPRAWVSLGLHEFGPLWPDPAKGEMFNAELEPTERYERATRAIAAFEKAVSLDPVGEQRPHSFASLAYTQRAWARPGGGDPDKPDLAARVDLMRAWEHRKALCDLARTACPAAPSSPEAYANDVAALAKQRKATK